MIPDFRSCRQTILTAACALLFCSAHAQTDGPQRTLIPSGPYRIAGTVINAKTGSPLAHSRVTIADAKNRQSMQSVVTGNDGRFEFHVPAAKYSLDGAKRGFITASYNQHDQFSTAIVTGADLDTENLALRLAPNAVLTGKVLDEFQDPVRRAQITVYRENHFQGVSRIFSFRSAMTDDQGRYEVTPLNEGTYFVSAKASPWYAVHPTSTGEGAAGKANPPSPPPQVDPSLDVVYPITYYGDATEAEDAAPIPVRGGDRLEADIHLNPVPSLHLIVHVPQDSTQGMSVPVLQRPSFDGVEEVENSNIQNVAPGVVELTGVAAGRYTVRMRDSSGQLQEPTEVNLNSGGELDVSSGRSMSKIKATVQIEGAASLPSQLQIGLRNSKGRVDAAEVDAKGEANFAEVIPGNYDVVAGSATNRYSVVRMASEAGTISGHALSVPPGASLTVALSLVGGSVTVEGFAKRTGKGASGAMIVLVPKDPEANHDRFRRDQSDLDGSFSLPNVIPGSYTIIAIENGWDLDWSEPAVLAQYLAHGQTLEVGDRSPTPMRLTSAVEVQAK
jgi:5-hydroxyisourate hydrolase-like protein (transthyretin family)